MQSASCAGADDNIVVLRAASRAEPGGSAGQLSLSLSKGVVFEKNAAAAGLERLRKARFRGFRQGFTAQGVRIQGSAQTLQGLLSWSWSVGTFVRPKPWGALQGA